MEQEVAVLPIGDKFWVPCLPLMYFLAVLAHDVLELHHEVVLSLLHHVLHLLVVELGGEVQAFLLLSFYYSLHILRLN
jgi:hypothetical protein